MKKYFTLLFVAFLSFSPLLAGGGGETSTGSGKTELYLACASSLTDAMNEAIGLYTKEHPQLKLTPSYGASGALQKQIEQGAPVDLFFSAGVKQMDALRDGGVVDAGQIRPLLKNRMVLIVPKGKTFPATVQDLADPRVRQVALGEPGSVPAGQYARQILEYLKILDVVTRKTVYAQNVRQVLTWVESGEVDAGLVYASDALIGSGISTMADAPAGSHQEIIYPAAPIKASIHQKEVIAFLDWLAGPLGQKVFGRYGFVVHKG